MRDSTLTHFFIMGAPHPLFPLKPSWDIFGEVGSPPYWELLMSSGDAGGGGVSSMPAIGIAGLG